MASQSSAQLLQPDADNPTSYDVIVVNPASRNTITVEDTDWQNEETSSKTGNGFHHFEEEVNEDEDEPVDTKRKKRPLTFKDKLLIVVLSFATLSSTSVFSCLAPFFPSEATKKGLGKLEVGIIFSIYELIMFAVSPIYGRYVGEGFLLSKVIKLGCTACNNIFGHSE